MQTKRERVGALPKRDTLAAVEGVPFRNGSEALYEQIEESFLKEDFGTVEGLSAQYLSGNTRTGQTDEVLYLRALALLKLGRLVEGREKLSQLERETSSAEIKTRASFSLANAYPLLEEPLRTDFSVSRPAPEAPPKPLRQFAVEESLLFSVQVGSFSKRQNAERLLNRLIRNRYDAYVSQDAAMRLFRVRVGKLARRQEALALEERLKKGGYPTKIFP